MALHNVGGATPGLVVSDSTRKEAEQATGSESVKISPPWSLNQLLPPGS